MAPWDFGHAIIYLAERPVLADPFNHGMKTSARFYSTADPREAVAILKQKKARYVVSNDMSADFAQKIYAGYLGLNEDHPLRQGHWQDLFQMRILTDLPVPGPDGRPSLWGHNLAYRSERGQVSLYEFDPHGIRPVAKLSKANKTSQNLPEQATSASPVIASDSSSAILSEAKDLDSSPAAQNDSPAGSPRSSGGSEAVPHKRGKAEEGQGEGIVARIGKGNLVTERDLQDWQATQSCYPSGLTSRKAAFMRQMEATIVERILSHEADVTITKADYKKEEQRIDRETRAPDILRCIKNYFGSDPARYWRVFLRPILANRKFHQYVHNDAKAQKKAYGLRAKVQSGIAKGQSFKKMAGLFEVEYATRSFSLEDPHKGSPEGQSLRSGGKKKDGADPMMHPELLWNPSEAKFIKDYLMDLKPEETRKEPIEEDRSIQFVRLLKAQSPGYDFESLTIKKLSTAAYCQALPKIPAWINDPYLKSWVASIHGNTLINTLQLKVVR